MTFLDGLPRQWITIALPGVGGANRPRSTYQSFSKVPVVSVDLSQFQWLRDAREWPDSAMAVASPSAATNISLPALTALIGDTTPSELITFVSDPDLRRRLPSATDANFDLGEELRAVDGGRLVHLVSDSQWVIHWSLYIGDDGEIAVVASDYPVGFRLSEDDRDYWSGVPGSYFVCALSFSEFIWRWWMDNEVFSLSFAGLPLTDAQLAYLDQYGEPGALPI